jgi:catechol O-methyltransferase
MIVGYSSDSTKLLVSKGYPTIDMLFVDHWEKCYVPDLKLYKDLQLLRTGSVVVADNTNMPGVQDYLEYVRGWRGGRLEI